MPVTRLALLALAACAARAPGPAAPTRLGREAVAHARACELGRGTACTALGDMAAEGRGVPRTPAAAQRLYQRGCALGDAAGCRQAARWYTDRHTLAPDEELVARLRARGCDLGDAAQCLEAGENTRADVLYDAACQRGEWTACRALADGVGARSFLGGADRELAMAERGYLLQRQACQRGELHACWGVDADRAVALEDQACQQGDHDACVGMVERALATDDPYVGRNHLAEARAVACAAGEGWRCLEFAANTDADGQQAFADKACAFGLYEGCDFARKKARAVALLADDCVWGDRTACYLLGRRTRSRSHIERACLEGVRDACMDLPQMHATASVERVAGWRERACAAGSRDACMIVADELRRGQLLTQDRERAADLYRTMCHDESGGHPIACANLADMVDQGEAAGDAAALRARTCRLAPELCQ